MAAGEAAHPMDSERLYDLRCWQAEITAWTPGRRARKAIPEQPVHWRWLHRPTPRPAG